jgi:hypothetical protein
MKDEESADNELSGIRKLPRERPAPASLEDRIVRTVRRRGTRAPWLLRLAVGVAVAAVAYTAGWLSHVPWSPDYLIVLYPSPEKRSLPPDEERVRVAEYGAWVANLRSRGYAMTGEELSNSRIVLPRGSVTRSSLPRDGSISGYFLLRTRSDADAIEVARSCPHLRHGGVLELRPIEHH